MRSLSLLYFNSRGLKSAVHAFESNYIKQKSQRSRATLLLWKINMLPHAYLYNMTHIYTWTETRNKKEKNIQPQIKCEVDKIKWLQDWHRFLTKTIPLFCWSVSFKLITNVHAFLLPLGNVCWFHRTSCQLWLPFKDIECLWS